MKIIYLLALMAFSVFGQAITVGLNQSYILMDNGKAFTVRSYAPTPEQNLVSLFRIDDFFFNLNEIEVKKSNYFIDSDDNIFTVSADGYMYKNANFEVDSKIKHYGDTFFITRKGSVYVVNSQGFIIQNSSEFIEDKIRPQVMGANYIITKDNSIIMINPMTSMLHFLNQKIDADEVDVHSNNFLTTKDGTLYTFGFVQNTDYSYKGIVSRLQTPFARQISKVGGNFFFDRENNIHTVSFTGLLDAGVLDRRTKVNLSLDSVDRSTMRPTQIGSNYFIYSDGSVYIVDSEGLFSHLTTIEPRVGFTSK